MSFDMVGTAFTMLKLLVRTLQKSVFGSNVQSFATTVTLWQKAMVLPVLKSAPGMPLENT